MNYFRPACMIFASAAAAVSVAYADPAAAAKAGMRQRVAAIDALKATGAVGEANTGLLAVRTPGEEAEKLVAAENADREVVFAELAKRTGGTPAEAGKIFARQIAAASKPGVWLQREDGGWFRK